MKRLILINILIALVTLSQAAYAVSVSVNCSDINNPVNQIFNHTGVGNTLMPSGAYVQVIQSSDNAAGDPDLTSGVPQGDTILQPGSLQATGNFSVTIVNLTASNYIYIRVWETWNGTGTPTGYYGTSIPGQITGGPIAFTYKPASFAATSSVAPPAPTVTGITPNSGLLDQILDVTINGTNGNWSGNMTSSVIFGGSNVTVNTATGNGNSISANITIAPNAATGARDVTVAGANGKTSFTVKAPTVTGINPTSGIAGQIYNVIISGTDTSWSGDMAAAVSFGAGITVNSAQATNATTIAANIRIAGNAATGPRSVTVAGAQGSRSFTVNAAPAATLTSIAISPNSVTLHDGQSQTYTVTAYYSTGTNEVVSGAALTPSPVLGNVAGDIYTAPATIAADTAVTITATYQTKSASATINLVKTIVIPATLVSIAVTPANPAVTVGNTRQFVATGTYSDLSTRDITSQVTWQSLTPSVATINTSGLATGVAVGTSTIKATYGLINGQTTLTIKEPVIVGALTKIVITPSTVTINQGESVTFVVKGYDANGNETADVLTYVSDLGDNSTTVTANVAAGEYLFAASSSGISATATINVKAKYDSLTLRINKGKVSLYTKDALGNEKAITYCDSLVYNIEGSENGNKVTVDGTIIEGSVDGTYVITATATIGSLTLTGTNDVTVNKKAPTMVVKIDGQDLNNNIAISSQPKIDISASDGNGVKSVRIYVDGTERTGFALNATGVATASYTPDTTLAAGSHTIMIEAEDANGVKSSISAFGLKVYADVAMQAKPMNYPNPFKPTTGPTTIYYKLTKAADTKIAIYDVTGRMVYTQTYLAGNNGGLFGDNTPTWTGKAFADTYVGNGVYMYFISSNGKVLGTGEISVNE